MFASRSGAPGFSRAEALAQVRGNDPAIMAAWWEEMMAMDLRQIACAPGLPCRIAYGGQSRVYPAATAAWLAAPLPGPGPIRFARSGHSPHLEEPEAFAAMIRAFEAELPAHR